MAVVDLDSLPRVALGFMDADHREEARLLNELADAVADHRAGRLPATDVLARYEALDAHTRAHFAREEAAMQRAGFPPYPVHKAEHDHVLAEMADEGRRFRKRGDRERLWAYVSQAVPSWLAGHIGSMDLVTARFIALHDAGEPGRDRPPGGKPQPPRRR